MLNKLLEAARVCVEFCVKLKKSTTKTFEMIEKILEDRTTSRFQMFERRKSFLGVVAKRLSRRSTM